MRILLVSTYELGRQPFGLASPAAWLRERGHEVTFADLSVNPLPSHAVREAGLVALYLPMHTATRLAAEILPRIRSLNPQAHVAAYGLYAPLNERWLREIGVQTVLGGEFEPALTRLADRLAAGETPEAELAVALDRLLFIEPDRRGLPALARYARLRVNGSRKIAGSTEASRGCKHLCRHCPVVPVYGGAFRIVQPDVVMADVRQQVAAGAEHISFGDPDFLNGPAHARRVVEAFHSEFPQVSYDATIKVEHLLRHCDLLPVLKATGCLFITTAVESNEDEVLRKLDKGHTWADFVEALRLSREEGLTLAPTFVPFTPWTTRAGYQSLLRAIVELDLAGAVAPVQLALRLLITGGSRLLELDDIRAAVGEFDAKGLVYRWRHPDPGMDDLAAAVLRCVNEEQRNRSSRERTFERIWALVHGSPLPEEPDRTSRTVIPYMDEPWFC